MTEITASAPSLSSAPLMAGVHVTAGGRTGQELTAEHSNLTGEPSSTSSPDEEMVGLGRESEQHKRKVKRRGLQDGRRCAEGSTGTSCGDDHAALEVELEVAVTLQPEVVVVIVSGRQVHEDGGAVLLPQVPRQVPLQEVQAGVRSRQARVKHLSTAPAASPPHGPAGVVQVLIPDRRQAEPAGNHHAGAAEAIDGLRHEGSPVLTAAS